MKIQKVLFRYGIIFCLGSVSAASEGPPSPQMRPWFSAKQDTHANFYSIKREFNKYWQEKSKRMAKVSASTQISSTWEIAGEDDELTHFQRWAAAVEPRVYPTGDLSLAYQTASAMLPYIGLNGQPRPIMAGNWTPLGPSTVRNDQGGIGRLNFIRFDPTNPAIVYTGSPSGGLWVSMNGGKGWTTSTDNLATLGVADLAINPVNTNIQYLATGDANAWDTPSIGLLKSIDGGLNWTMTGLTWTPSQVMHIHSLLIHPSNPSILLVGASNGVYRSTDAGVSWTLTLEDTIPHGTGRHDRALSMDLVFKANDPNVVIAAGKRIYRSNNGGASFTEVASAPAAFRIELAVTAANPQIVYAVCGNERSFLRLLASTDGGITFSERSNAPNILGYAVDGSDADGQAWYDLAIAVSPIDANLVLVGGVQVWKSIDGGRNWLNIHGGMHTDIQDLRFQPGSGSTIFMALDAGIYKSTNTGTTWVDFSNDISVTQIYRLGMTPTSAGKVLTGMQDNGTNLYVNGVWTHPFGGDGMECFFDRSNPSILFASTQNGSPVRSKDGGLSWTNITPSGQKGPWNTPWLQDPKAPNVLYWGNTRFWKSIDKGDTWSALTDMPGTDSLINILVDPTNTRILYGVKKDYLGRSEDGGVSWSDITGNLPVNKASLVDITLDSAHAGNLWVCLSGYADGDKVYRSLNSGATWINYSEGLPNLPGNAILFQKSTNGGVYLGSDLGVYYRDNTMNAWIPFFNNLPSVAVYEMEIFYGPTLGSSKLRAATFGRGLWESPLYAAPVVGMNPESKASWTHFQAMQGKDGKSIAVRFESPRIQDVFCEIMELNGRRATLKKLSAGVGPFSTDIGLGARFQSGIYYVVLKSGEAKTTQPVFVSESR